MTQELIAKLESASEGSRELDALVTVALRLDCKRGLSDDLQYLSPIRRDDECAIGTYWYVCRSGRSLRTAEPVTTSIDAALALAERVLPKLWTWRVEKNNGGYFVAFWSDGDYAPDGEAVCASPALAICAALLRASAAQGVGQ